MQSTPLPKKIIYSHCQRLGQQKYNVIYQDPFKIMDFNVPEYKKFIDMVSDTTFKKLPRYKACCDKKRISL